MPKRDACIYEAPKVFSELHMQCVPMKKISRNYVKTTLMQFSPY